MKPRPERILTFSSHGVGTLLAARLETLLGFLPDLGSRVALLLAVSLLTNTLATAEDVPQNLPDSPVSFSRQIAPVLARKCQTCHGPNKSKAKYRLDSFSYLTKPGDSGDLPVVAGHPERSKLYQLITASDPDDRMPQQDDPLPPEQIQLIEQWIRQGARFDGPDPDAQLASIIPRAARPRPPESYPRPVPVLALAFSPDGRELAASGYHEVTFWDSETGALLRRAQDLPERIYALAWSATGPRLAVAAGSPGQEGEIAVVDPASAKVLQVLDRTPDVVLCAAFSPDDGRLAAGGTDNMVVIYDLAGTNQPLRLALHADWVTGLCFSPDGARLATASRDRTARVCDSRTGELLATFTEHETPVTAVAFRADGKHVFSAGRDKRVRAWDAKEGTPSGVIKGYGAEVLALAVGGESLFSGGADAVVKQHKASDRSLVRSLSGHCDWIYALAYHAGTHRLASGSYDGEVRVWDSDTGELVIKFVAMPHVAEP